MAARNIVVIRKAGLTVSPAYIEKVAKEASYLGIGMVLDGKILIDYRKGVPPLQAVMDVQNADELKNVPIIFNFGAGGRTFLDEDMQPFHIKLGDGGDSIAVFLDGKFEGYTQKNSSHSDDFHCKEDFLSPKLKKLYKAGGMAGLVEELKDPITQQDFSNSWTNFGFMAFMTSSGEIVHLHNKGNLFVHEYPWGITSNWLNHADKEEPVKVEEPKQLSILERLRLKKEGKLEATPEPKKLDIIPDNIEDVKPTDKMTIQDWDKLSNKDKIKWWVNEVGYKPELYKLFTTCVRRIKGTNKGILLPLAANTSNTADAGGVQKEEVVATTTAENNKVSMQVDPKTLPDKVAPENAKDTSPKHVSVDNIPIVSPKTKIALRQSWFTDAEVVKTLGDDMKTLARDPKRLKEFEDNVQTFLDGLGLAEDTYLSFEALMKLGIVDIKPLAVFAFNKQNDAVRADIKLKSIILDPANKIATKVAM